MDKKTNHNCSTYDFLYERNKGYMNYTALSDVSGRKITYEELHERIFTYAKVLRKKGIKSGDKVAVLLDNTIENICLLYALDIIGVIRIGFSILNNNFKMNRDFNLLQPQYLITTELFSFKIKDACAGLNIQPIMSPNDILKDIGTDIDLTKPEFDPTKVTDILFTGGSTGIHKGVKLNGNGLNYVIKSLDSTFTLEPGMVHLGNIPFGHMIFGRFALHYSLANNLEYALTLEGLPDKFLDELIRTKANGAMGGPVHWNALQNHPLLKPGSLSELHQACTGGEMLKTEDEEKDNAAMKFAGSDAKLINMLGLTEMSGATHINIPGKNTPGTIGSPIEYVEDIIVDPKSLDGSETGKQIQLQEVPHGQTGLLLTKGPGMLLGYYNNEIETNKVFIYDQYGTKWYNTGDLVKRTRTEDKETAFSGRLKRNFVCGYDNIYPEQIEDMLSSFPEIKEIVVTKIKDEKYQFLPVYHISLADEECNTEALKNKIDVYIEQTLGAFALPGYIYFTTGKLPRNKDNGKLDIQMLEENGKNKIENETLKLVRKIY